MYCQHSKKRSPSRLTPYIYYFKRNEQFYVIKFNGKTQTKIVENTIRQNFDLSDSEELKFIKSNEFKYPINHLYIFNLPDHKVHFVPTIDKISN